MRIDRTFIRELRNDPRSGTVVELVLGMAKSLRLDVAAEGVETTTQPKELRQLGVTAVSVEQTDTHRTSLE